MLLKYYGFKITFTQENPLLQVGELYVLKIFTDQLSKLPEYFSENRKYPIKFPEKVTYNYDITLNLPEGYTIHQVPNPFALTNDLIKSSVQVEHEGPIVRARQMFIDKNMLVALEEIPEFKAYWKEVNKANRQTLMLQKQDGE